MELASQTAPAADEFYILKRGKILGPFTEEAVRAMVERGEVSSVDFVQQGGLPLWQPLARWLDRERAPLHPAIAPDWKSIATWVAVRLRHEVIEGSLAIGLGCAAIGTVVAILARWPATLWLPWFAIAVCTGILAVRNGRVVPGLAMLLAVAAVPVAFSLIGREAHVVQEEPAAEEPQPTPQSAARAAPTPAPLAVREPALPESPAPAPAPAAVAEKPSPPSLPPQTPVPPTPMAVALPPTPLPDLPPLPETTPSTPAPSPPAAAGDLVQRYYGALVLVNDGAGSGSGFICQAWGQPRLFTNIHVIAGMKQPRFTGLDGTRVSPGAAEAAAGHDIMRMALPAAPATPLELLTGLESSVKIGDEIVVLGNSGGGGVVTKLEGKLVGIGPDRIEVSAEFIPGNSGSPIVHVPTGKVIGIATYLTRRYEEFSGNTQAPGRGGGPLVVRRFGYRLDSVSRWEPVNWAIFQAEAERIQRISALTEDIFDFLGSLRKKQSPDFATDTLRRPATEWLNGIRGRKSEADRLKATQGFLAALRAMARADVVAAETQLRYSCFREELRKEREVRDKLYKAFDDDARKLASPVQTAY